VGSKESMTKETSHNFTAFPVFAAHCQLPAADSF
jgi:hypothetical protein